MKLFIACSKAFYTLIPPIKEELESYGHMITCPNSYDNPNKEEEIKIEGLEVHLKWKKEMLKRDKVNILPNDGILVLNLEKNGQENYIGGATFLEMHTAFLFDKKIFLYNPIPDNMFKDELIGFDPIVLNKDLKLIKLK